MPALTMSHLIDNVIHRGFTIPVILKPLRDGISPKENFSLGLLGDQKAASREQCQPCCNSACLLPRYYCIRPRVSLPVLC